jgi:hypothetical protein
MPIDGKKRPHVSDCRSRELSVRVAAAGEDMQHLEHPGRGGSHEGCLCFFLSTVLDYNAATDTLHVATKRNDFALTLAPKHAATVSVFEHGIELRWLCDFLAFSFQGSLFKRYSIGVVASS